MPSRILSFFSLGGQEVGSEACASCYNYSVIVLSHPPLPLVLGSCPSTLVFEVVWFFHI